MNKRDMKQIFYIKKERELLEEKLARLEQSGLQSPKLDGMPRASGISKPTEKKAEQIAELKEMLEELEYRTLCEMKRIYEYIRELDDSLLRQIIILRCIDLCTWDKVAIRIGGGNTADSVRKRYDRHFDIE